VSRSERWSRRGSNVGDDPTWFLIEADILDSYSAEAIPETRTWRLAEGRKRVGGGLHRRSRLCVFWTKGEFFCSDCREGAVDAAGNLAVGHGANHCQFFRCPPAERAEPVETAAEALGHSASESDGLRAALDAAQSLAGACGFGRGFAFPGRGLLDAGFGRAGRFNDLAEEAVRAGIEAGDAQLLAVI
jgi:hypothetical protein